MAKLDKKEQDLLIAMAVREVLMGYYKGVSRSERLTYVHSGITLRDVEADRQYQYQRRLLDMRQPKALKLGGVVVADMAKNPSEFTFTVKPVAGSEVEALFTTIKQFFKDYLPAVTVKTSDTAPVLRAVTDEMFFGAINVELRGDGGYPPAEDFYANYVTNIEWNESALVRPTVSRSSLRSATRLTPSQLERLAQALGSNPF